MAEDARPYGGGRSSFAPRTASFLKRMHPCRVLKGVPKSAFLTTPMHPLAWRIPSSKQGDAPLSHFAVSSLWPRTLVPSSGGRSSLWPRTCILIGSSLWRRTCILFNGGRSSHSYGTLVLQPWDERPWDERPFELGRASF